MKSNSSEDHHQTTRKITMNEINLFILEARDESAERQNLKLGNAEQIQFTIDSIPVSYANLRRKQ